MGDYGGALTDYNQAIAANPQNAKLYNARGKIKALFGHYDEAIDDCTKAISLQPDYADAWLNRGLVTSLTFIPIRGATTCGKAFVWAAV